jgi:mannose-6-phosphate isomerase-like protein (cupin superfamily)
MRPESFLHPVTGERLWIERSALSGGGTFVARLLLPPGAHGGPPHLHPDAAERFDVLEGTLDLTVAGAARRLGPREALEVPPGQPHGFRNASGRDVLLRVAMDPGAALERFLRGWYGLAAEGRLRADGTPRSLLALGALLAWGGIVLDGAPARPQALARHALARLAAWSGVTRDLARHLPPGAPA